MRDIYCVAVLERAGKSNDDVKVIHRIVLPELPINKNNPMVTREDFVKVVNNIGLKEHEVDALTFKVDIQLDEHHPKNFYEFQITSWKYD